MLIDLHNLCNYNYLTQAYTEKKLNKARQGQTVLITFINYTLMIMTM